MTYLNSSIRSWYTNDGTRFTDKIVKQYASVQYEIKMYTNDDPTCKKWKFDVADIYPAQ